MTSEGEVVICRSCVSECIEYKNIFRQGVVMGELTTLAAMLRYCTNLDFPEEEDFMPSNMCNICIVNLAKLYVFKQTVFKANETLRKLHSEQDGHRECEELHDSSAHEQGQEPQHFVTLTVVDEGRLESQHIRMHMENVEENCEISAEAVEEQEILDDGDHEVIYQEEELEESFKVEDEDYGSETYVFSVHEASNSALAVSIEGSDLGEVEEEQQQEYHRTVVKAQGGKQQSTSLTDHSAAQRLKEVKPRTQCSSTKPPNPDLQCQVCRKQLSNINSFRYHMQLHSDSTPFLCSLCGEGFKTRNAYGGHMSMHDPNNPNTCEICGKTYRQAPSLRTHMLTHTGEKPFHCNICGKGLTQKSGYKKHMLTHTGEKPHTCDICGRAFRYSSNLISHRRQHSGEKPHDCPLCEKSFSTSVHLRRHTLVHTGEKPFNCEVCNRRFNRRSSLNAHLYIHDPTRVRPEKGVGSRRKSKMSLRENSAKNALCVKDY